MRAKRRLICAGKNPKKAGIEPRLLGQAKAVLLKDRALGGCIPQGLGISLRGRFDSHLHALALKQFLRVPPCSEEKTRSHAFEVALEGGVLSQGKASINPAHRRMLRFFISRRF